MTEPIQTRGESRNRPRSASESHDQGQSQSQSQTVSEIISEFTQVFSFVRTRWAGYAEQVHPDLRGVGMTVLQAIFREGPITATELGHLLGLDKAVVSRQVTKLRQLDLVVAQPDEADRRVVLLTASESAHEAIAGMRSQTAEDYRQRFAGWSESELRELRALLHRFNSASQQPEAEGPAVRHARRAGADQREAQDQSPE